MCVVGVCLGMVVCSCTCVHKGVRSRVNLGYGSSGTAAFTDKSEQCLHNLESGDTWNKHDNAMSGLQPEMRAETSAFD